MTTHLPQLPIAIDPLIAEAKERARRRRQYASLALLGVVAVATVLTLCFRPGGFFARGTVASVGINASPAEVAAIEQAVRTAPSAADAATLRFTEVRISTINRNYALVKVMYTSKCAGCTPSAANGEQGGFGIVQRTASGWHETFAGSSPPRCGIVPVPVYKELSGSSICLGS